MSAKGTMRARKLRGTVGHPLVTSRELLLKARDHDFFRAPAELYSAVAQCSQNVLDTALAQCSLGFLTNTFKARHSHTWSHIHLSRHNGNVRPVDNDRLRGVFHTTRLGFPALPLSIFPKWTKSGLEILWRFWQGHIHQICPIFRYQRESWSIFSLWLAQRVTSEEIWPFMYWGARANSARTLRNATFPKAPL